MNPATAFIRPPSSNHHLPRTAAGFHYPAAVLLFARLLGAGEESDPADQHLINGRGAPSEAHLPGEQAAIPGGEGGFELTTT